MSILFDEDTDDDLDYNDKYEDEDENDDTEDYDTDDDEKIRIMRSKKLFKKAAEVAIEKAEVAIEKAAARKRRKEVFKEAARKASEEAVKKAKAAEDAKIKLIASKKDTEEKEKELKKLKGDELKKAEEDLKKSLAETERLRKVEEDAKKAKAEAEEEARIKKEAEAKAEAEEEARIKKEEALKKAEALKKEVDAKAKTEEEARIKKEEALKKAEALKKEVDAKAKTDKEARIKKKAESEALKKAEALKKLEKTAEALKKNLEDTKKLNTEDEKKKKAAALLKIIKSPEEHIVRLTNPEMNRCYMNSVLQLIHRINPEISKNFKRIEEVNDILKSFQKEIEENPRYYDYNKIGNVLVDIINYYYSVKYTRDVDLRLPYEITQYAMNPLWKAENTGIQQDIEEFIVRFFEYFLHKHCWYDQYGTIVKYDESLPNGHPIHRQNILQLIIGKDHGSDIQSLYDNFTKIEILEKSIGNKSIKTDIINTSDNLIILLKRFSSNKNIGDPGTKIQDKIKINETLKIYGETFKIDSCIYQTGDTINNGHYIILIYDNGKPSYVINDMDSKQYKDFNYSDDSDKKNSIENNAYMLLYKKVKVSKDGNKRRNRVLKSKRKYTRRSVKRNSSVRRRSARRSTRRSVKRISVRRRSIRRSTRRSVRRRSVKRRSVKRRSKRNFYRK